MNPFSPSGFVSQRNFCAFSTLALSVLALFSNVQSIEAQTADLSRLVVVGDSLSAGVQNFSLLDTQQPNGYAPLIAKQAGVPLVLPLISYPGLPNVLQLTGFNPLPVISAVVDTAPAVRDNPGVQPTDVAEPGTTVAGALLPPAALPAPVGNWASIVLGESTVSQVAEAVALRPTTIILWLGNNDALVPALTGAISHLTPVDAAEAHSNVPYYNFTDSFNLVVGALAKTGATLIIANVPDVTEVPFFTPVTTIAQIAHLPVGSVAAALGTGTGDYLRSSALQFALNILTGETRSPLPATCSAPFAGFPANAIPCILTANDASTVRNHVSGYNAAIGIAVNKLNSASNPTRATLVDVHALVDQIYKNGYQVPGRDLTAGIFGGIFSLDYIHPTNTGYAIIANQFISAMNSNLNTGIPQIDVKDVAKQDPLVLSPGQLEKFLNQKDK